MGRGVSRGISGRMGVLVESMSSLPFFPHSFPFWDCFVLELFGEYSEGNAE